MNASPRGISLNCLHDLLHSEIQLTFNRFVAYRSELMRGIIDMRLVCQECIEVRKKILVAHEKATSVEERRLLNDLLIPLNELELMDDDNADIPLHRVLALIVDEVRTMSQQDLQAESTEGSQE